MKTMALKTKLSVTALGAAALLGGFAPLGMAQPSPVGPWDLVLSGVQRGTAQITFSNNFTLGGFEIITVPPRHRDSVEDLDPRNPTGDGERTPPISNGDTTIVHWYGAASLQGSWTWDAKGNVIGVLNEFGPAVTNGINFKAVVRPGVRITINATREGRAFTYKGIPLVAQASLAGNYYATGGREKIPFTEILTFTPGTDLNSYDVVGTGPAYTFTGTALVSGTKHIALYTLSDETTNLVLRSVSGPFKFSATTGSGDLKGISEDPAGGDTALNVKLKLRRQ
jgi:hypothetical protein